MNEIQGVLILNPEVESTTNFRWCQRLSTQTCLYEKAIGFFNAVHNFHQSLFYVGVPFQDPQR